MKPVQAISNALHTVGPINLGVPPGQDMLVKTGTNAVISGGANGVISVDERCVDAIGVCVQGGRDSVNEDSIGVAKDPNGSLLFHVADGMGGHEAGEIASKKVIGTMGSFYRRSPFVNFEILHAKANDMLTRARLPKDAGSTYAGIHINPAYPSTPSIGVVGDSQITSIRDGKCVLTTPHDGQALEDWTYGIRTKTIEEMFAQSPEGLSWLENVSHHPREKILESAGLLYRYVVRSSAVFNWMPWNRGNPSIDRMVAHIGGGSIHCVYTDGVGDMFTHLDSNRSVKRIWRGVSAAW